MHALNTTNSSSKHVMTSHAYDITQIKLNTRTMTKTFMKRARCHKTWTKYND